MNYWSDLFSPATYEAFGKSDRTSSGFRESQRTMAEKIQRGDKFVCYMVRMSRWIGVLEVLDGPVIDTTPVFVPTDDPFIVRFKVRPIVWLPPEQTIPIRDPEVFSNLTFTREVGPGGYWQGPIRRSLLKLSEADGAFLQSLLCRVQKNGQTYPLDRDEFERALGRRVHRPDRSVVVSIPDDKPPHEEPTAAPLERESVRIQASLCRIGEAMKFKIWLPTNDRSRVFEYWSPQPSVLLDRLPLNYDETTL